MAMSKFSRGLMVLGVAAFLAVLVWRFTTNTDYFYYGIGAAVLVTAGTVFLVYRKPAQGHRKEINKKTSEETGDLGSEAADDGLITDEMDLENIPVEEELTDIPTLQRSKIETSYRTINQQAKPRATDVAARYMEMAAYIRDADEFSTKQPAVRTMVVNNAQPSPADASAEAAGTVETSQNAGTGEPPIPLIEDETVLTEEEQNKLVNSVWYRCENPYCQYTSFLGVHHIKEEKDGGTNRLDNLIVLCPFCHDLAHKNEIPEREMRNWISNREERFKFKPTWPYV
jgi:hypothetical protein